MDLMHRLQHLVIHLQHASPMGCTFPRLVSCDIGVSPGDTLVPFLQRHPHLTRLRIAADDDIAIERGTHITLLNLEHYDGPASLIPALVIRQLREAWLDWHSNDISENEVERIVAALASLTTLDFPFLSSHEYTRDCCGPIISSLSRHMPYIKTLRMSWLKSWNEPSNATTVANNNIRHFATWLSRFTGLTFVSMEISCSGYRVPPEIETTFSVEAWAAACPTLQACCVSLDTADGGPGAWKKVNENWEPCNLWIFRALAGLPVD
ncbi:hypothetical protein B0H14DRAFT_3656196 [Mycena olivaceomarginata]|nr:hypothetical protein B0H14DRAFT_3656196 [Mycena olivaceomarginata]